MQRDPRAYLYDMLAAAVAIDDFLRDTSLDTFVESDLLRSAVERKFEIIGEALSQLAKIDAESAKQISGWRDIIGFRNFLAHGYPEVDYHIVWRTYRESLPKLRREVETMLGSANPP